MRRRKEKRERSIVFSVAPPFFLKNFPEMQDLRKFFTTKTGLKREDREEREEKRSKYLRAMDLAPFLKIVQLQLVANDRRQ